MKFVNIFVDVLKQFGDFKTRTGKTEFWVFFLGSILVSILIGILRSHTLNMLYSLLIFVPAIAVGARRLHDIGKSGWNQLWALTIIGIIYLIILWVKDGEPNTNKWGEKATEIEI